MLGWTGKTGLRERLDDDQSKLFSKRYLENNCLLRLLYSLHTWGSRGTEILRNSSSWRSYIHSLNSFPPGYGGESNFRILTFLAWWLRLPSHGRGTRLLRVGAHDAAVLGSVLIPFCVLFCNKHSHPSPWIQLSSDCRWLHVLRSVAQGPCPVLPTTSWRSPPWVYHKQVKVSSPKPNSVVAS